MRREDRTGLSSLPARRRAQRLAFLVALAALCALVALVAPPTRGSGPEARAERQTYRREHRPYDGSPPIVPHAVKALGRQDCLSCHRTGLGPTADKGQPAPRTPHPHLVNCQQCHVERQTEERGPKNGFAGMRNPPRGTRRYAGAPPTIPHRVFMREVCVACHGDTGGSPIRSPHPDRVNCRQCHVEQTSADLFVGAYPVASGSSSGNTFGSGDR
jgi:cytochrome c-type protein NapB